jgi:transposase-like protein
MLGAGKTIAQTCKKLGVTEVTYYRWRREYDGADRNQVKRLKELEKENAQLKRLLADQVVENRVLKDIAEGKF